MTKKLTPVGDRKTITELNPSYLISGYRWQEVIQALRKYNRTCNDGRIKSLVIQKINQIHNRFNK